MSSNFRRVLALTSLIWNLESYGRKALWAPPKWGKQSTKSFIAHKIFHEKRLFRINDVGLRGHYICLRNAAKLMVKNRKGLMVITSSPGGFSYLLGVAYGVNKAGVITNIFYWKHEEALCPITFCHYIANCHSKFIGFYLFLEKLRPKIMLQITKFATMFLVDSTISEQWCNLSIWILSTIYNSVQQPPLKSGDIFVHVTWHYIAKVCTLHNTRSCLLG